MKILFRLLSFLSAFRWQAAFAILLGCIMIASNMALLGMAAYLIAAAALAPLLVTLTLPIYIVRFASVSRAGSRYLERLVSHDVTFRLLAQLRIWVYSRLEPLAPAYLQEYRSGDVLTRLVSDVEELQNVYLRVFSPIIVAIAIGLLTFGLFSLFSPVLAWTALSLLILAVPLVITKAIDGVYLGFLGLVILAGFEAVQPIGQAFQFLGHSRAAAERVFKVADAIPIVRDTSTTVGAGVERRGEGTLV